MAEPLLSTKLLAPRPRPSWVPRRAALARLSSEGAGRLVVVAAPAGFGKTTLVASWAATMAADGHGVAWLTLDEGDNDAGRFWGYVLAALEGVCPDVARRTRPLLTARDSPRPRESMLTVLINDLATCSRQVTLVLDDYHVVTSPAVHEAVAFLVEHLPPNVQVALVTRQEPPLPLAQWRARGALVEIGPSELRFSLEEAEAFLRQTMGLALSPEAIAALETRTEGWITGLQLAALALRDHPEPATFVDEFSGSHRYVFDYLAAEVLRHRDGPTRAFLLRTSILDRLSGPLCDAVTGGDDGVERLAALAAENLFLLPLDDVREWYRYHRLFADFLRARLSESHAPEEVARLQRSAADWYHAQGLISPEIRHLLAAGAFDEAAARILETADDTWARGRHATLIDRIDALPAEVVARHPHLVLQRAHALVLSGQDLDGVEPALAAALAGPAAAGDALLHARAAVVRAALAGVRNDADGAIRHGAAALAALPPEDLAWRGIAEIDVGLSHAARAEFAAAGRAFEAARALGDAAGGPYAAFAATVNLARARDMEGRLHAAHATYREAIDLAAHHALGRVPLIGLAHVGTGDLAREWDDLPAAEAHVREGIRLASEGPRWHVRSAVAGWLALVRVLWTTGRLEEAAAALATADDIVRRHGRPEFAPYVALRAAHLALRAGDAPAAARFAAAAEAAGGPAGLRAARSAARAQRRDEALLAARIRLALGDLDAAEQWLEALTAADAAAAEPALRSLVATGALVALARAARGARAEAVAALRRAIAAAEPEGYVRTFADHGAPMADLLGELAATAAGDGAGTSTPAPTASYVATLLAAARGGTSGPTPEAWAGGAPPARVASAPPAGTPPGRAAPDEVVEALTEREREVLALIAAGASNQRVADALVVALSTVKTHVNNIYGKLGVHSRTQAVARARALGLID